MTMNTKEILLKAAGAVASLQRLSDKEVSEVLREVASTLRLATGDILAANASDLARMNPEDRKSTRLNSSHCL